MSPVLDAGPQVGALLDSVVLLDNLVVTVARSAY